MYVCSHSSVKCCFSRKQNAIAGDAFPGWAESLYESVSWTTSTEIAGGSVVNLIRVGICISCGCRYVLQLRSLLLFQS